MTGKTIITVPIYGMSCQKCVARVTTALQKTAGVLDVDVSLSEQLGRITVAIPGPSRDQLLGVVVKAGFQVVPPVTETIPEQARPLVADDTSGRTASKTSVFAISGMTCAKCAQTIEKGVAKLLGVVSAMVNFAAEKLTVVHDPGQVQSADLIAKVDALGYRAATQDDEDLHEGRTQFYWLIFAACLSLPIMPLM